MPLVRQYTFADGTTKTEVAPEFEREWRGMCMEFNQAPTWRNDPTYDLKRRKPK